MLYNKNNMSAYWNKNILILYYCISTLLTNYNKIESLYMLRLKNTIITKNILLLHNSYSR